MNPMRIAVIGGGPGGLVTTYYLNQNLDSSGKITLFEAGPRLGGKILTQKFERYPVSYEAGVAELYDYSGTGPDPLKELILQMGLKIQPIRGESVILGNTLLHNIEDIRRVFGEKTAAELDRFLRRARSHTSPQEYYESDWKQDNADPLTRRSFRALLDSIPDETARRYIAVAVHSDLATEPHQTNATYGIQNYLMNEPDYMRLYTIEGGIERLPQELAARIQARVLLNQPVRRVERTHAGSYRVTSVRAGEPVCEEFDVVVAALPNGWLPLIEWAGETLNSAFHRHHRHYDYPAHYLRVDVLFSEPFWRQWLPDSYFMLDAFGGCCVYDESSRDTHARQGVLGWLLAGEAALILSNLSDAELIDRVLDSLPDFLQHGRTLKIEGKVHRWTGAVNGLPGGIPVQEPLARHQPDPVHHPRVFVVGDYLFDSTINGVVDSAEIVADRIEEWWISLNPGRTTADSPAANGESLPHPEQSASVVP